MLFCFSLGSILRPPLQSTYVTTTTMYHCVLVMGSRPDERCQSGEGAVQSRGTRFASALIHHTQQRRPLEAADTDQYMYHRRTARSQAGTLSTTTSNRQPPFSSSDVARTSQAAPKLSLVSPPPQISQVHLAVKEHVKEKVCSPPLHPKQIFRLRLKLSPLSLTLTVSAVGCRS